jgi:hypothetical protein
MTLHVILDTSPFKTPSILIKLNFQPYFPKAKAIHNLIFSLTIFIEPNPELLTLKRLKVF